MRSPTAQAQVTGRPAPSSTTERHCRIDASTPRSPATESRRHRRPARWSARIPVARFLEACHRPPPAPLTFGHRWPDDVPVWVRADRGPACHVMHEPQIERCVGPVVPRPGSIGAVSRYSATFGYSARRRCSSPNNPPVLHDGPPSAQAQPCSKSVRGQTFSASKCTHLHRSLPNLAIEIKGGAGARPSGAATRQPAQPLAERTPLAARRARRRRSGDVVERRLPLLATYATTWQCWARRLPVPRPGLPQPRRPNRPATSSVDRLWSPSVAGYSQEAHQDLGAGADAVRIPHQYVPGAHRSFRIAMDDLPKAYHRRRALQRALRVTS